MHILFTGTAAHSGTCNIQKSEYAGFGLVNNLMFENRKIPPAGSACIHHGGHSGLECKIIRRQTVETISKSFRLASNKYMGVNINNPGYYIQTGRIYYFLSLSGRNINGNLSNLSFVYSNIHFSIHLILRINHMTVLY